ncbi:putative oxidoreductase (fatty acid repression mutant protein) [Breznakia sp. PF5-3]|uniref:nitroreductase family protein n=1 Tax=unclassified Breznakia TaxID=2623764 RepID=UPI0024052BA8|nr:MULTISPECIES: nitroreductase family protein [unclassified Breznakia]MDL2276040.1 nitroreductase family protein [Breznakia sp. OttesenSCG-928-G09]MDF9824317.1 putative oxidoreductase (fatty acid repression mutant protein) [Breznakia sp. PM6-1]MDF9835092.1 putative oxidoreductase (fatty acid repression mutant protein) [Breznakia sp. PF5-3]MDF9838464.1 putative oxidoreductase (fatty acid repression mutant protein) [Breznakia sp. PFB2-8]MDF9860522.1 putative oxidoreductase (fatty acid repressio
MKTILDSIKDRRSIYTINDNPVLKDEELEKLIKEVTKHVPSPYNMQSQRVVLLLGEEHHKLWNIVLETLRKMVPEEKFGTTEAKIKTAFDAGYATILYFEDEDVVKSMGDKFPSYRENFNTWSTQANGMLQYALWTTLESEGYGASLQHYNPIIDDEVKETWNLPKSWKLYAQMPIGKPTGEPGDKEFMPIDEKVKVFK